MERLRPIGLGIFAAAAIVTVVRIGVTIAGATDQFWTSGTWEVLMVVFMFAALALVVAGYFLTRTVASPEAAGEVHEPEIVRFLFSDARSGYLWLVVRLYVGFVWLQAGYGKLMSTEGNWINGGTALKQFWTYTVYGAPSQGAHSALAYNWYRDFLKYMLDNGWYSWFAKVIAIGETTIGILLILGAFAGVAALLGAILNFNFGLAGVAGVNPLLLVLAIAMVAGWKVAGYVGLDRYLLPELGTPWQRPSGLVPRPPQRAEGFRA